MRVSDLRAMLANRRQREDLYGTAEYWDSKAEQFDDKSVCMWPNNHLNAFYHREQIAVIEGVLGHVAGKRLLDLGCGTGRLSRYFAERGATVLGIDFSAKSIRIAQRESSAANPRYCVQSVFDLDREGEFDTIIAWGVLTVACKNEQELLDALRRLRRALILGGTMLLMEPIHKGFLHRVLNLNLREFCKIMDHAGFKIETVTQLHFWPARLALAYLSWPLLITAPAYYVGQWTMRLLGNKSLGDYKAIYASVGA